MVDKGVSACLSNFGLRLLVTRLKNPECTKIKQLIRHKGFAIRLLGCSPISDECVSKDEGLRKGILSKAHHSSYTIYS